MVAHVSSMTYYQELKKKERNKNGSIKNNCWGRYEKNHRERRILAKKIQAQSLCKKHNKILSLHGTQLICDTCRSKKRLEKQRKKGRNK